MLIVLPIGLWILSLVGDIVVHVSSDETVQTLWFTLAYYTMAGGLVGALLAAVPGLIDFLSMSPGRIKKLATVHMALNLTVVALYAVNLWLRTTSPPSADLGFALSLFAVLLLGFSGWIGGEMVHVHGVGVSAAEAGVTEPPNRTEAVRGRRTGRGSGRRDGVVAAARGRAAAMAASQRPQAGARPMRTSRAVASNARAREDSRAAGERDNVKG